MKVNCDIGVVISFLIDKMNEGFKTVELIGDARASGWFCDNPTIEFIFNKREPTVIGINATVKYKDQIAKGD